MPDEEIIDLPPIDKPSNVWIDGHLVLEDLRSEEIDQGELMGRMINVGDHLDNGLDGQQTQRTLSGAPTVQMKRAVALRASLLDHGVASVRSPFTGKMGGVSIELQVGKGPSSSPWSNDRFIGHLNHHTAGPRSGLTPSLSVCKLGRSDLEGPLCNGYGGRDFIYRIITLGYANHPGLGGPAAFGNHMVPKDNGRPYLWGTEWDHDGVSPWLDEQLEWMARANAGILDWLGVGPEAQGEHKDPWAPRRKPDRNIITRAQSIARTKLVWNNSQEEEDMPFTDAQIQALAEKGAEAALRKRYAAGQLTPVEALQTIKDVQAQGRSNGSQLSALTSTVTKMAETLTALKAAVEGMSPPDQPQ